MLKTGSWAHGNAVVVEEPNNVLVRHWGWGTEMQFIFPPGGTSPGTWCHIPIPTPVVINDVRVKLQKVFLLFKTGQHAAIDNLHIFDGPRRVFAQDFVVGGGSSTARRTGDHAQNIDGANTIVLPTPLDVSFGISLSFTCRPVALNTAGRQVDPEGTLLITTAGADFI